MARPKFLTLNARDASTLAGIAAFGRLGRRLTDKASRRIAEILLAPSSKRGSKIERETAAAMRSYMTPPKRSHLYTPKWRYEQLGFFSGSSVSEPPAAR